MTQTYKDTCRRDCEWPMNNGLQHILQGIGLDATYRAQLGGQYQIVCFGEVGGVEGNSDEYDVRWYGTARVQVWNDCDDVVWCEEVSSKDPDLPEWSSAIAAMQYVLRCVQAFVYRAGEYIEQNIKKQYENQ